MRNLSRFTQWGAVLAALAIAVTACGGVGSQASTGNPQKGGNLIIARNADSASMDMTTVFDNDSIWVGEQIMETLYMVKNDGSGAEPWLATGYDLSSDKLTWTFHLRKGVKFTNGQDVTSADVKFSLDQTRAAKQGWAFIDSAIDRVDAPDPSTVVIHTSYAWAPLLSDLSLFANAIIPKDYAGQTKDAFYQHPIGTGPFKWGHWDRGRELQLVRNDSYWQPGKPYLNSVTWSVVPDDNSRVLQLRGGQANIVEFPAWSQVKQLQSEQGIVMKLFPSTKEEYIILNENQKPLDDVHVRRAISYALDRKAMVHASVFGYGQPGNSLLAPADQYYDKNAGGLQYDLAAAKRELAQSSVPQGFTITLLMSSGNVEQSADAQIMQQELQSLGITLNLKPEDPTSAHADQQKMIYPMAFAQWTQDITDPDELVSFAEDPQGGAHAYFTNYNNPQVIAWTQQAEKTFDPSQRANLYAQIQAQTAKDAQLLYLYYIPYPYAMSSKVHSFVVTPMANYRLGDVWLSQ